MMAQRGLNSPEEEEMVDDLHDQSMQTKDLYLWMFSTFDVKYDG